MHKKLMMMCAAGIVGGACTNAGTPASPNLVTLPLQFEAAAQAGAGSGPKNHRTHLTGDEEVPARSTLAEGQAVFQISADETSVSYRLIASNITNITQAHIHCGAAGSTGPIVVWLFPSPTATTALPGGGGRHDGVLAANTFTGANVRPTTNPNCPGGVQTLADVIAHIRTGVAYVNVHTDDGVAPANTGPGDFPGGEVRGQLD